MALVTEVLLQRTKAEAVQKIFNSFFEKFPDSRSLSEGPEGEILKEIHSLGLLWRAKKLKELGKSILGGIPDSLPRLMKLPGVGLYAAGAYLSFHRGVRASIPDSNSVRIICRYFGIEGLREPRRDPLFLELCDKITPRGNFKIFNYAILDFGRNICTPKKPLCGECPLMEKCQSAVLKDKTKKERKNERGG